MTRTDIAKELRRYTLAGTVSLKQLAGFLGYKDPYRVGKKFLQDDPESQVPHLEAIGGTRYLITEVAIRLKEASK